MNLGTLRRTLSRLSHSGKMKGPEVREHLEASRTTHPSLPRRTSDTMSVYDAACRGNNQPAMYPRPSARAITTSYRGCRFRSRLEARWAVFFDYVGIGWQYEHGESGAA